MAPNNADTSALPADQLVVNLNVLSPSTIATSGGPLSFTNLPATSTIRDVKEKIRQALPVKPTDAQQRLIYRGRPLQVDDETLLHLMGEDTIREHSQQTVHLVIRGVDTHTHTHTHAQPQPSSQIPTPSTIRGRSPAGDHRSFLSHAVAQGRQQSPHRTLGTTPPPGSTRRAASSREPSQGFAIPNPPASFTPQQMQQMQSQIQSMAAWTNGLQREAVNRAMVNQRINQNQSARASMGMHGIGDNQANNPAGGHPAQAQAPGIAPGEASRGRASPSPHPYTRTTVREGTLADGQPYRVTNTETWTPLSTAEVQNILRGGDAGQATQAMTNAMQRSESPASFNSGVLGAGGNPGVTTPYYPTMGSRAGSRGATPDPASRSVSGGSTNTNPNANTTAASASSTTAGTQRGAATPSGPEVYILSSPQGPRALLVNNNAETYYTPLARQAASQTSNLSSRLRAQPQVPWQLPNIGLPTVQHVPQHQPTHNIHQQHQAQQHTPQAASPQPQQQQQAQQQQPHQPQMQQAPHPPDQALPPMQPPPLNVHGNNNLMAPMAAQLWQHVWLMLRLAIFVWLLTSRNSSWTRWATVIAVAISIFLFNTGVLNGVFDQAAGPVRRHMDNLIPVVRPGGEVAGAGGQNGVGRAGANDNQHRGPGGAAGAEPNPAQAAGRLVAERRHANANWLTDQVRRLERAGLLFIASIAPGVAERHIAQLEAEERAERRRREEAEQAAAADAAAAAEAENANAQGEQEGNGSTAGEPAAREDGAEGHEEGPAELRGEGEQRRPAEPRAEPLVAL